MRVPAGTPLDELLQARDRDEAIGRDTCRERTKFSVLNRLSEVLFSETVVHSSENGIVSILGIDIMKAGYHDSQAKRI
jgi:hypothetical protein